MKKDNMKNKQAKKERRRLRVRAKISGSKSKPRLSVFRSLKHITAQLVNDETGQTLVYVSDKGLKGDKIAKAKEAGKMLAEKALAKKIVEVVFDRSSYKYHGRVAALAEGARSAGLKF